MEDEATLKDSLSLVVRPLPRPAEATGLALPSRLAAALERECSMPEILILWVTRRTFISQSSLHFWWSDAHCNPNL